MNVRDLMLLTWVYGTMPLCIFRPFYGIVMFSILAYNRTQDLTWGQTRYLRLSYWVAVFTIIGFAGMVVLGRARLQSLRDGRAILMIFLLFWILVSIFDAVNPEPGWWKFSEFWKIILVALITPCLVYNAKRLRIMFWVIALSIGFYGVKTALHGVTVNRGPGGMLQDNNDFSCAMVMALPFLYYLGKTERRKIHRVGFLIAVPLTMVSVALTDSRGGFLALTASIGVLVMQSKQKALALAMTPLIIVTFFLVVPDRYIERIKTIREPTDASAQGRLKAWKTGFNMVLANPLTGVGYRNFQLAYRKYNEDPSETVRVAHNSYVQLMAESGFPALFLFLGMIGVTLYKGRRLQKRLRKVPQLRWIVLYSMAVEASLVGYVVAATFLNRAHFDLLYHIVGLTIALDIVAGHLLVRLRSEALRQGSRQNPPPEGVVGYPLAAG
jgi:probable O-glycosylation ligase (exosortase A-associated)